MRFLPATLLLLAPLAGCALNAGFDEPRPNGAGVMSAWIMPDPARSAIGGDSYTVYTSHAAHIAVFEVVPGRGMGLVYPSDGWHEPYVSAGLSRVVDIAPTHRWSYFRTASTYPSGPRYVVLIASEMPLQIDALRRSDFALRRSMHYRTFAATNPYGSIDALLNTIVPPQDPAGWDVDVYAIWPDHSPRPPALQMVQLMCPGSGQVFRVPLRRVTGLPLSCGTEEPASTGPGDEVPVDSVGDDDDRRERVARPPGDGRDGPEMKRPTWYGPTFSVPALARRPVVAIGDEEDAFAPPAFRTPSERRTVRVPGVRRPFVPGWARDRRDRFDRADRSARLPRASRRVDRARPSVPVVRRPTPAPTVTRAVKPKTSSGDKKTKTKTKTKH